MLADRNTVLYVNPNRCKILCAINSEEYGTGTDVETGTLNRVNSFPSET